jgi:aldehyde dehydrogenase (NAD+)
MSSGTGNNGQGCSNLTRLLVPRARLAEAEELAAAWVERAAVGDPSAAGTTIGPVVSATQRERVGGYLRDGVKTSRLIIGGPGGVPEQPTGYFVQPTVFTADAGDRIAQEEIFGPVEVIIPHDGDEDAVQIANATMYGLSGAVFSGDVHRARRVARGMRTGQVHINCEAFTPEAPFGGYRQSGVGRTWGLIGFEEYLETKAIMYSGPARP